MNNIISILKYHEQELLNDYHIYSLDQIDFFFRCYYTHIKKNDENVTF